jgi:hypothetical protein
MHQPGYVQGGQEVGRGYLLLGIHYRRIREHSTNVDLTFLLDDRRIRIRTSDY